MVSILVILLLVGILLELNLLDRSLRKPVKVRVWAGHNRKNRVHTEWR